MQPIRKINKSEREIVKYLAKKANLFVSEEQFQNMLVQKMEDGDMGSFLIFQDPSDLGTKRKFGKQVSEFEFVDDDNIPVLVSLNIDDQNKLFEVDIWKADFKPVLTLKIPS